MSNLLAKKIYWHIRGYIKEQISFNRIYFLKTLEVIIEHNLERELNIETAEADYTFDRTSSFEDGTAYESTPYLKLKEIVNYLKVNPEDVFIDLGCGRGRVVFFFSRLKLRKLVGVDSNQELIDIAKKNLSTFKFNNAPIEFINFDVATLQFKDESIFFMFNPFGALTMKVLLKNIKESLAVNPRSIHIIYYNPVYKYILNDQDWLVLEKDIGKGCCLIWRNKNNCIELG